MNKPLYVVSVWASSALLMLLGGCSTKPPESRTELQPAEVRSTWSSGKVTDEDQAVSADYSWLEDFEAPELSAIVSEALEKNFDLRAAYWRLQSAEAVASASGADLYPEAGVGVGAARRGTAFRSPSDGSVNSSTSNSFALSLDVSWELDVWGRLSAVQSAAYGSAQAAAADLASARLSLAAQTASLWLSAAASSRQALLANETLESFRKAERTILSRYERGVSPALDLRLARNQSETASARLQQRRQQLDSQIRQLEVLLGRYPARELQGAGDLPALRRTVPSGLPSDLLHRRPDIIAAERRVASAQVSIEAARKAFFPRISLTSSVGQNSDQLDEVLRSSWSVWSLAGNIVQPIFQGRRLTANLEQAKARAEEAVAQYGKTTLTAFREVESALASESFLRERLTALESAEQAAFEAENAAWEQYERGLTTLITVLESQRRLFESRSSLIDAQLDRLLNRIDLHLALAGGFGEDIWETPVVESLLRDVQLSRDTEASEETPPNVERLMENAL